MSRKGKMTLTVMLVLGISIYVVWAPLTLLSFNDSIETMLDNEEALERSHVSVVAPLSRQHHMERGSKR
ncbi:hypothetical protein [Alteribacter aurantiacus]|uniref:hypothetical protein n=1 Tax=Alteribacter aurantiacus TaxID=254410 RepID=UPI00040162F2|nr:hypothetical protein [Alteribacter aurantiacus]